MRHLLKLSALFLVFFSPSSLWAGNPSKETLAIYDKLDASEPDPAEVFHFMHSWQKSGTLLELQHWLRMRAEKGAASDWLLLAFVQESLHHGGHEAVHVLDQFLTAHPTDQTALFHRARLLIRDHFYEAALKDLDRLPASLKVDLLRVICLDSLAQSQKSKALWKQIISTKRSSPEEEELIAESLWAAGQKRKSLSYLERSTAGFPNHWRLNFLHANLLNEGPDPDRAIPLFQKLLSAEGKLSEPLTPGLLTEQWLDPSAYFGMRYSREVSESPLPKGWAELSQISGDRTFSGFILRSSFFTFSRPKSAREARLLAFLKLVDIGEVPPSFSEPGLEGLGLFVQHRMGSPGYQETLSKLIASSPEDLGLRAVYLETSYAEKADLVLLKSSFDLLIGHYPIFAAAHLPRLGQSEVLTEEEVEDTFIRLISESSDPKLLQIAENSLFRFPQSSSRLADHLLRKLLTLPKQKWGDRFVKWLFQEGRVKDAISLINHFSESEKVFDENWVSSDYLSYLQQYYEFRTTREISLDTLIPERFRNEIPFGVLNSFFGGNRKVAAAEKMEQEALWENLKKIDSRWTGAFRQLDLYRGLLDETRSPVVAALFAYRIGDEAHLEMRLTELRKSSAVEHQVVLAALLEDRGQEREAYEVLTNIDLEKLSLDQQFSLSLRIVALRAIALKEEAVDWGMKPAREAFNRASQIAEGNDRHYLGKLAPFFGQETPAKPLRKQFSDGGSYEVGQKMMAAFRELIEVGQMEQAAKRLIEICVLSNPPELSYYGPLIKLAGTHDLLEPAAKIIAARDTVDGDEVIRSADFLRAAGLNVQAAASYRAILDHEPDHVSARLGLLFLDKLSEQKSRALIGQISGRSMETYLLGRDFNFGLTDHEVLSLVRLATVWLESGEEAGDRRWIGKVLSRFFGSRHFSTGGYCVFRYSYSTAEEPPIYELYDSQVKAFFLAMLNHSDMAERGFKALLKAKDRFRLSKEDLVKSAKRALRSSMKPDEGGGDALKDLAFSHFSHLDVLFSISGPLKFLLSEGSIDTALDEEVMELLKANDPQRFKTLSLAVKLGGKDAAERLAALNDWEAELSRLPAKRKLEIMGLLKDVTLLKSTSGEFEQLIIKLIPELLKPENHGFGLRGGSAGNIAVAGWLRLKVEEKSPEELSDFLNSLRETVVGSRESWPILSKLGIDQLPHRYRKPLQAFDQVMRQSMPRDEENKYQHTALPALSK